MINNVVLVGRLTKDPELKVTTSGIQFVNFTVAVNRSYLNANGEQDADFINCIIWRKQAENLAKFMKKGSLIGIEGNIQTRQYNDGEKNRYITEVNVANVKFLESKKSQGITNNNDDYEDDYYKTSKQISEDDLPF